MGAGHRRWSWRSLFGAGAVLLGSTVVSTTITAAPADAAPAPQFGAPTGYGCSGVGLSQGPSSAFTSLGVPVYAWDGVPLLGTLEDPGKVGKQPLLGPSCGDLAHGSYETGAAGSGRTGFSTGADDAVGATSTVHTNVSNPLMALLGRSVFVYAQSNEDAFVVPQLSTGDQSFTITVTYTITSSTTTAPPASAYGVSNRAGTSLSYTSSAAAPSCDGQQILGAQTGDFVETDPGTYTAQTEFSCPPGETLTDSEALGVTFNVVQSGWFEAGSQGADYAGNIVAEPDAVTVSVGS